MSENDKLDQKEQRMQFARSHPTIGLFTTDLGYGQASQVWSGANDAARELGINLLCFPAGGLNQRRQEGNQRAILSELATAERIDGLITFHWWQEREIFERFYERYRPLPVVNVMRLYEGYPGVAIDNEQDMQTVMQHMIEVHGYRRIAYVRNLVSNVTSEARFRAYKDALANHNIPLDNDLIIPCDYAHSDEVGARTAAYLLDDLALDPSTDLDAIATYSDDYAARVLEALQARGVRVPYDVAVIAFDDDVGSDRTTPPLTTMAMPRYDMGKRAVDLVLAQIKGSSVPEETIVPARLVVRQSCGCLPAAVTEAGYMLQVQPDRVAAGQQSFKDAWRKLRKQVQTDMVEAIGDTEPDRAEAWAIGLLDAFSAEIEDEASGSFMPQLDQVLRQALLGQENQDAAQWQSAVSTVRRHFLSVVEPASPGWLRGESLCNQARMLIKERDHLARMQQRAADMQRAQVLNEVGQALAAAPDVAGVADVAASNLSRLGIERCYLSLYENAAAPSQGATVILALNGGQREKVDPEWAHFPAQHLAPQRVLPRESSPFSLVVEPLFSQQEQIGLALFDAQTEGTVYESLRSELSAALRSALLVERARHAQHLLDDRVKELSCLNDLGHKLDQNPPLPELLTWLAQRIPSAMQHPDLCVAAIQFEGRVYGASQALDLNGQIVQGLRIGGEHVGQVHIAYREQRDFLDEESALLGDIARRIVSYIERQRLTNELASEQGTLEKRARQLQAVTDVSSTLSGVIDLETLTQQVVDLAAERFGLYYAGLFLVDTSGEWTGEPNRWAVLRAGTGHAGKEMVERGHKLELGGASMIGRCIASGQADIQLRASEADVRFANPLLPHTRSEMALPLVSRGEILGALTIQSTQEAAFTQDDVSVLQSMANQVANAIANARLVETTQARVREMEILAGVSTTVSSMFALDHTLDAVVQVLSRELEFTYIAINVIDREANELQTLRGFGLAQNLQGMVRTLDEVQDDILMDIARKKEIEVIDGWDHRFDREIWEQSGHQDLVRAYVPLLVREASIGILEVGYHRQDRPMITQDQVRLLRGIADRVAVAIENARLIEQTRAALQESQILYNITQGVSTAASEQDLLNALARPARDAGAIESTLMYVELDASGQLEWAEIVANWRRGGAAPAPVGTRYYLPDFPFSQLWTANADRATLVPDLLADERVDEDLKGLLVNQIGLRAMVNVPLVQAGHWVGVLTFSWDEPHQFSAREETLYNTLSGLASPAVESRQLLAQAEARAAREQTLREVAERIRGAADVDTVMRAAALQVGRLLDREAFVYLTDEKGDA